MSRLQHALCSLLLLAAALGIAGCRISQDAGAVASQVTSTAGALEGYYTTLAQELTDTIAINELEASLSHIPFSPESRAILVETRAEILKREELAESIARIATSFTALAGSSAPADIASSASLVGKELIDIRALSASSPVPEDVGKAGQALLTLLQERKEREIARALDGTLGAVEQLFAKEKPLYDGITSARLFVASQVAGDLITAHVVDPTPLLDTALRPFHLAPLPSSEAFKEQLWPLTQNRLRETQQAATARGAAASAAMLATLTEISARVHRLATRGNSPQRGDPVTLHTVLAWIAAQAKEIP